jgi:hypothetical protein
MEIFEHIATFCREYPGLTVLSVMGWLLASSFILWYLHRPQRYWRDVNGDFWADFTSVPIRRMSSWRIFWLLVFAPLAAALLAIAIMSDR